MKGKNVLLIVMMLVLISMPSTVHAKENITSQETEKYIYEKNENIVPSAAVIGWRYKTVNGVMYRRKFNYSKNQWIGEW